MAIDYVLLSVRARPSGWSVTACGCTPQGFRSALWEEREEIGRTSRERRRHVDSALVHCDERMAQQSQVLLATAGAAPETLT